ncbi:MULTISPECIES: tyrosine-protein phosphatase [unclassified Streptomyces]|uniref:tyrosine-protein phosphatase n=1 Tax=unclassified Streptomyces TaxID=2593676 RepID=UPI0033BBF84C
MGEIHRSDALNRLSDADLAKPKRLGVHAVYDLRMESERASAPDRVPAGASCTVAADAATLAAMPPAGAAVHKPLLDVRPEYLNSGFDEVRAEYGDFRSYLKDGLHLDARELRDLKRELLAG